VVFGVLDAVVLYLSYSRNTWLALGLALTSMLLVVLRRARYWHALTVAVILGCGVALYVASSTDLGRLFAQYNSVREGSLGSRTAIYAATWQAVQELPFPLLGNGVKDRVPGLVASLGTHSGYLGTLYRGGWLALGCLLVWLVVLAVRSWRAVSPLAMGSTVFAAVWFVAEDIDAGHLAPLALVVALAAIGEAAGSRLPRGATADPPTA
jgi:O-antigen ligase